jgi:hypothetical protein
MMPRPFLTKKLKQCFTKSSEDSLWSICVRKCNISRNRCLMLDDHTPLEEDIEGDVLILDPEKLGKRLPNVIFDKMRGREELNPIKEVDEEMILEPVLDLVRNR